MFCGNFLRGTDRGDFIFGKRRLFCGKFRREIPLFVRRCGQRFGIRTVLFGQRNGNRAPRRRKSPYLDGLILLEHHGIADDFRKTQLIGRRTRHIEFVAGLSARLDRPRSMRLNERENRGKSKRRGAKRRKREFYIFTSKHFFSSWRKRQPPRQTPRARR